MKIFTLKALLVALVAILASSSIANACNLSSISLCGVYKNPLLVTSAPTTNNDSMICLNVCNGYGRTGTTKGADNDTRSISFGWYTHRTGFLVRAFTPANITSARGFSNCTMPGSSIGPQGAPYNSQGTIIYVDPGYYGLPPCFTQPFGCVTSTALCGNAAQQCITYRFQVNKIPDSVRVFGVEGGGNPVSGCYPDADMAFNFTTLAVEWGNIDGIALENSVKIKWSTLSEVNTDIFILERAAPNGTYSEIGTVAAAEYSSAELRYEMVDLAPMPGINRYRILQVDQEGNSDASAAVEVNFNGPSGLVWGAVGPNPATDFLNMTFYNERSETLLLTISNMEGKSVVRQEVEAVAGANAVRLALDKVNAGSYFVTLQGAGQKLTRKIVKL